MNRTAALCLSLASLTLHAGAARAEGFTESWYMLRGRANLEIGNQKAAIEAFEKACELNPDNREAMRSLGLAYGKEGLTDKAVAQFDRYLAKWPDDSEIAFKQAEFLSWSRYDYRRKDAVKYLKMGLAKKDDPRQRRKLAKLLGRDKATLDEALDEYRKLLAQDPGDETLRTEYRKLLSWDPKHLSEAIKEQEAFVKTHPDDFAANEELAKLLAQDPDRRADAAALYGKLVARRPKDASLRLTHARLLSGLGGKEDEALDEYRAVLKTRNDQAVRLEYADALAKRPATRAEALQAYRTALKAQPRDDRTRVKYANLLLAEKSDAGEAAKQYDQVLAHDPKNAEAHRGAAKAYAWLGDEDRALMHGQKAEALGGKSGDVARLTDHLEKGREPRIGLRLHGLAQPNGETGEYFLRAWDAAAFARRDFNPFTTGGVEIGGESYQDHDHTAAGPSAAGQLEYRWSQYRKVDLALGYHGVGPSDRRLTGRLQLALGDADVQIAPGIERTLRKDSLLAVAGKTIDGSGYGAARSDDAFVDITLDGGRMRLDMTPLAGYVTTAAGDKNLYETFNGRFSLELTASGPWRLDGVYVLHAEHYQTDRSGFGPSAAEPLPGGYVSPTLLLDNVPQLALRYGEPEAVQAGLDAGPSLQLTKTVTDGTRVDLGVEADAYLETRFASGYELALTASYLRLPLVDGRYEATASLAKLF